MGLLFYAAWLAAWTRAFIMSCGVYKGIISPTGKISYPHRNYPTHWGNMLYTKELSYPLGEHPIYPLGEHPIYGGTTIFYSPGEHLIYTGTILPTGGVSYPRRNYPTH